MAHSVTHPFILSGISMLALLAAAIPAQADTTWTAGSTITIDSNLSVADVLTIEPGVTVKLGQGVQINVQATGTLNVNGTAAQPVLFTKQPTATYWGGIHFLTVGAQGTIAHATIEKCWPQAIWIERCSPTISDSIIREVGQPTPLSATEDPLGSVYGIRVNGSGSSPSIMHCVIKDIIGPDGKDGTAGSTGAVGPDGPDGGTVGPVWGLPGGDGGVGGAGNSGVGGRSAYGLSITANALATIGYNQIFNVRGGKGGIGGAAGKGGKGGQGGTGIIGPPPLFTVGAGAYGGRGGVGGQGGEGGGGGPAVAIFIQQNPAQMQVYQNLIYAIQAGDPGQGGRGGDGGAAGKGGDGASCSIVLCTGGDGGWGGIGGFGGSGGDAGNAPAAQALNVSFATGSVVYTNNTVGSVLESAPVSGGGFGLSGAGAAGGAGGSAGPGGTPGQDGQPGHAGFAGASGSSTVPNPSRGITCGGGGSGIVQIEAWNNIIALGNNHGIMLQSGSPAIVSADYNCFYSYETLTGGTGTVTLGDHNVLANPQFIGPDAGNFRLTAGSPCVDKGSGNVVLQFARNSTAWKSSAAGWKGAAFDQFYPGLPGALGCLSGSTATPTLALTGCTMNVSAVSSTGTLQCAITDASTTPAVSDGSFPNAGSVLKLQFSPPIRSFFSYFGSLATGTKGKMTLFAPGSSGVPMATVNGAPSPDNSDATGFGFVSSSPVDRIDVTVTDSASLFGAFVGLASGEPALGTVTIPGYSGPSGSTVQMDFAYDLSPSAALSGMLAYLAGDDLDGIARTQDGDGDGSPVADLGAYEFHAEAAPPCPADLDGNHVVNGLDLAILLGQWTGAMVYVPCPPYASADLAHDCKVNGLDLAGLLGSWGRCP